MWGQPPQEPAPSEAEGSSERSEHLRTVPDPDGYAGTSLLLTLNSRRTRATTSRISS
jgi:hypothetical protein